MSQLKNPISSLCVFAPLREALSSFGNAKLTRLAAIGIAAALLIALSADSALAQCVMCRASLSNNSSFIRNFNIGVAVLLVPPVSMFCVIFVLAIRHRRSG
jgi:hypothetical protein